jgi:signal transduction histidine kinase
VIAVILWHNNLQKQKANALLLRQEHETSLQKEKAETALEELKTAQTQLVQSEKMASLGELTAGIAHEIQNPLNFVNNFSEVSTELIEEMEEELSQGNMAKAKLLAEDIKQNMQKINLHGGRADGIVKAMLQHSRSTTGKKEPTDINALASEYLRLSYHGFRAKNNAFSAAINTCFDESIPTINIVTQDIARVLLNLFNNAFYSMAEKGRQRGPAYAPEMMVSTKKISSPTSGRAIELRVRDNGNGIPENVLNKIFHPFFTTKPTGQGTGLGLSLSYDIITKGNNGHLKAETKEGEYAQFIVQLPIKGDG